MPNTKSAIRRVRRVKKQTQVNRIRRSKDKNAIKQIYFQIFYFQRQTFLLQKIRRSCRKFTKTVNFVYLPLLKYDQNEK